MFLNSRLSPLISKKEKRPPHSMKRMDGIHAGVKVFFLEKARPDLCRGNLKCRAGVKGLA